jgi:uncharacterized membrane protein
MIDIIIEFFKQVINNPYLVVLIISVLPLIELRGAIPVGFSMFIAYGMPVELAILNSFIIAFIGSSLIFPVIYVGLEWGLGLLEKIKFLRKIIKKIRAKFNIKAVKLQQEVNHGTKDISDLKEYKLKLQKIQFYALYAFVAVPLPLTGVYTASAVGVFAKVSFKKALFPIILGNFTAGVLISLASYLFGVFI